MKQYSILIILGVALAAGFILSRCTSCDGKRIISETKTVEVSKPDTVYAKADTIIKYDTIYKERVVYLTKTKPVVIKEDVVQEVKEFTYTYMEPHEDTSLFVLDTITVNTNGELVSHSQRVVVNEAAYIKEVTIDRPVYIRDTITQTITKEVELKSKLPLILVGVDGLFDQVRPFYTPSLFVTAGFQESKSGRIYSVGKSVTHQNQWLISIKQPILFRK